MTPLEKQLKAAQHHARQFKPEDASPEALSALITLGGCYRALGRWQLALRAFRLCYDKCCASRDAQGKAQCLLWQSNLFYHMGRDHEAISLMQRALKVSPKRHEWVSGVAYYLANPYYALGKFRRYVALQHRALAMLDHVPPRERRQQTPWVKSYLAKGLMALGKHEEARRILACQVRAFRRQQHRFGLPLSLLLLGQALTRCARIPQGQASLEEALRLYQANRQEGFVADTYVALSCNAAAGGDRRKAKGFADLAVRLARRRPQACEGLADMRHLTDALRQRESVKIALEQRTER